MIPSIVVFASTTAQATPVPPDSVDMRTALLFVVLVVLVFCIKVVSEMRFRMQRLEAHIAEPPAQAQRETPDDIPPEIVAAITAAIVATVGTSHRIIAVAPLTHDNMAWSMEGRRQVFQSHKLR